jgi:hypothetical protein
MNISSVSYNCYWRATWQMERKILYVCSRNFTSGLCERDNNKYLLSKIIFIFYTINFDFLKLIWNKYYRPSSGAVSGVVICEA